LPGHILVNIGKFGAVTAGLRSSRIRGMTGSIVFVDAGHHTVG
jgi:enoyl-[acyl-carrier-protein] reductase (NADH)